MLTQIRHLLELIRFSHTLFALPFAVAYVLPLEEAARAYAAVGPLAGAFDLRRGTVVVASVGLRVQLGVGQLGVAYLRTSQTVRKSTSEFGAPKYSDLGRISTDSAHSWTRRQLQAHPRRPPRIH